MLRCPFRTITTVALLAVTLAPRVCRAQAVGHGVPAAGAVAPAGVPPAAAADSGVQRAAVVSPDRWRLVPPRLRAGRVALIPKIGYSSETELQLGLEMLNPFRLPGSAPALPPSDLRLEGRATFEGQLAGEAVLRLNFGDGTYYAKTKLRYSDLPQRFYGIGRDTPRSGEEVFRPQSTLYYFELFRRVVPHLRLGLRYEFEDFELREARPGGYLDGGDLPGVGGGRLSGAGALIDWDTRDRTYSPTSGSYYQLFAMTFDDALGSGYDFNNYNVDLRNYFSVTGDHVLATQLFYFAATGPAPFWRMAAIGGRAHSRGYRLGRYTDQTLLALQAEYRMPVYGRLGLAFFGGVADVAPRMAALRVTDLKPTVGAGLRFRMRQSGINGRLDVAAGQESVRLYLRLDEAF